MKKRSPKKKITATEARENVLRLRLAFSACATADTWILLAPDEAPPEGFHLLEVPQIDGAPARLALPPAGAAELELRMRQEGLGHMLEIG